MIIYNKTWLSNLLLTEQVEEKYNEGLVSEDELKNIKQEYVVGFYTPNIFARAGMFLLTIVISLFSSGLLSLIFSEAGIIDTYGWFIFLGVAHYVILEMMVQANFHYRSGVDDALLWISAGLTAGAFYWAANNSNESFLLTSAFVFLLSLTLTIRFSDMLMCLVAYLSALAFVFFAWQKIGALGLATMPFVVMTFSAATYCLVKRNENKSNTYFYSNSIVILQVLSLLSLYISGNYYAVKELGDMLNGTASKSIPLGWFFWAWTIAMPFIYIGFGMRSKNRILLRTGLLLISAAALTFRNYYHLMPVEQTLTLCGIIALGVSWFLTNYLSTPKNGFTAREINKPGADDVLNIEALVISQSIPGTEPVAEEETVFGRGRFGGGGASSGY
jgi:hypothetical protein